MVATCSSSQNWTRGRRPSDGSMRSDRTAASRPNISFVMRSRCRNVTENGTFRDDGSAGMEALRKEASKDGENAEHRGWIRSTPAYRRARSSSPRSATVTRCSGIRLPSPGPRPRSGVRSVGRTIDAIDTVASSPAAHRQTLPFECIGKSGGSENKHRCYPVSR